MKQQVLPDRSNEQRTGTILMVAERCGLGRPRAITSSQTPAFRPSSPNGDGDDYKTARARLAEERRTRESGGKRWLMLLGVIVLGIVSVGVWLKPSPDKLRESVEAGLTAYARAKTEAGEIVPAISHQTTHDWVIGVTHGATVGDLDFFCVGGFKVTYCQLPDE